jgi:hypothetical protein
MDFLKKNKMTILGGLGMVAALYVYLNYFGSSSAPLTATNPDQISGDLLVTLNSLHTIKLDQTIFADPVFVSLSDFGLPLGTQAAGRRNPFAPVGAGATNSASPSTAPATKTTTVQPPTPPAPTKP